MFRQTSGSSGFTTAAQKYPFGMPQMVKRQLWTFGCVPPTDVSKRHSDKLKLKINHIINYTIFDRLLIIWKNSDLELPMSRVYRYFYDKIWVHDDISGNSEYK